MNAKANSNLTTSVNGTIEDVASFFRVSVRTVQEWKTGRKIRAWSEGRNVIFDEESVIDFYECRCTAARRMEPGELREIGRREWRAHLHLREEPDGKMAALERRVHELEKTSLPEIDRQYQKAAAA